MKKINDKDIWCVLNDWCKQIGITLQRIEGFRINRKDKLICVYGTQCVWFEDYITTFLQECRLRELCEQRKIATGYLFVLATKTPFDWQIDASPFELSE